MDEIFVKIPKDYLLILAVHGNMGDGEIPDFMRIWAEKTCLQCNMETELRELQSERLKELKSRISKVLGEPAVNQITEECEAAGKVLHERMEKLRSDDKRLIEKN